MFLRDGYANTSLAAIARLAGVAPRTLYLRFATKVELFQRVIATGIVGDDEPEPLPNRDWSRTSFTAETLDERIEAFADGVSTMHERLGPLMAVNAEVEAGESAVRDSAQEYRRQTVAFLGAFWSSAHGSGLISADSDLDWLVATSSLLFAAETRLSASRHLGWRQPDYRDWVRVTLRRLVAAAVVPPGARLEQ